MHVSSFLLHFAELLTRKAMQLKHSALNKTEYHRIKSLLRHKTWETKQREKKSIENCQAKIADQNCNGKETTQSNQKTRDKMAVAHPYVSITTLNANRPNSLIKKHRVVGWIKKQRPNYMLTAGDSFQLQRQTGLKCEGWKMILQANGI